MPFTPNWKPGAQTVATARTATMTLPLGDGGSPTTKTEILVADLIQPAISSPAYGATITVNAAGGLPMIVQVGTLTGNLTLANPTSPTNRQRIEFILVQDGTGNRTLTLGTAFRFPSSSTLSSPISSSNSSIFATANGKTRMLVEYDGADLKWDVVAFVPGYGL